MKQDNTENSKQIEQSTLFQELSLIQNCITRMANSSWVCKFLAIIIYSTFMAFGKINSDPIMQCFLTLGPLVMLWGLDAFFLYTEKLYRKLYDTTRRRHLGLHGETLDKKDIFNLNPHLYRTQLVIKRGDENTLKLETPAYVMKSKTLIWFYGILVLCVVVKLLSVLSEYVV